MNLKACLTFDFYSEKIFRPYIGKLKQYSDLCVDQGVHSVSVLICAPSRWLGFLMALEANTQHLRSVNSLK